MSNAERPLLDNIETSCQSEFSPTLNNINGFELQNNDKLSIALGSLTYYKTLTDRICNTLILGAGTDDFVFTDRARKMLECGTKISIDDNSGTIISANFCRLRICPMCQRRRSLKVGAEFHRIMDDLSCSWVHLVLTVPNCSSDMLSNLLDTMQIVSSRLFRYAPIKKAFNGLFRCTEITYNSYRGDYHPHFHCLVAVDKSYFTSRKYIKADIVRRVWTALMTACQSGVDVRRKSDKWIDEYISTFDDSLLYQIHMRKADSSAVAEVAKYCVKPLDIGLSGHALYEPLCNIFFALHSRRLIQTYGNVRESAHKLRIDLEECCIDATFEDAENRLDRTNVRHYNWNRHTSSYEV